MDSILSSRELRCRDIASIHNPHYLYTGGGTTVTQDTDPQDSLTAPAPMGTAGLGCYIFLQRRIGSACHSCVKGRSSFGEYQLIKTLPLWQYTGDGQGFTRKPTRGAPLASPPSMPRVVPRARPPPRNHYESTSYFPLVTVCLNSCWGRLFNFTTIQGDPTMLDTLQRLTHAT